MPRVLSRFPSCLQCRSCALENFRRGAGSHDRDQQSAVAIELNQRRCAFFISFQAHCNRLGMIVFALIQPPPALIADTLYSRGLGSYVEDGFALLAGATPAQANNN